MVIPSLHVLLIKWIKEGRHMPGLKTRVNLEKRTKTIQLNRIRCLFITCICIFQREEKERKKRGGKGVYDHIALGPSSSVVLNGVLKGFSLVLACCSVCGLCFFVYLPTPIGMWKPQRRPLLLAQSRPRQGREKRDKQKCGGVLGNNSCCYFSAWTRKNLLFNT